MDWLIVIVLSVRTFNPVNDAHIRLEGYLVPFIGSNAECAEKAATYNAYMNTVIPDGEAPSTHGDSVLLRSMRGFAQCVLQA